MYVLLCHISGNYNAVTYYKPNSSITHYKQIKEFFVIRNSCTQTPSLHAQVTNEMNIDAQNCFIYSIAPLSHNLTPNTSHTKPKENNSAKQRSSMTMTHLCRL